MSGESLPAFHEFTHKSTAENKPGDRFVCEAGAPGIGRTVYIVTGNDERGLWGRQIENTVRIGTMADFA